MKILCIIDSLGSGGAQRQLVNLAIGFKEKGHDVSFLVYHSINFFKSSLVEHEIPVKEIIEPNYLKRLLKMRRYIRRGDFDSVLSFLEAANFICEVAGLPWRKWKLVVGERSANPAILKTFKLRAFRWFHVFADYVVANSHANLELVLKANPFLPKRKCRVIYNALQIEEFKPRYYENRSDRNYNLIVIGASQIYVKNLFFLVNSFSKLDNGIKEKFRFYWYGNRIEKPYFDNSFQEALILIKGSNLQKYFKFSAAINNFKEVMENGDIIGLFSKYEGLPNVICEAMAIGKPVICSNISDMPLILGEKNKQLFTADDERSLRDALISFSKLKEIDLAQLSEQNYSIAKKLFDRDLIVNEYLRLL